MDLRRLRVPLVAVISTLLLAGGSVALAADPGVNTDSDADQVQVGDQSLDADTEVKTTEVVEAGVQDEVQDQSGADDPAEAAGAESEGDAAAQHAACLTLGINDIETPNVQYDETGACSLDTGGTDNESGVAD